MIPSPPLLNNYSCIINPHPKSVSSVVTVDGWEEGTVVPPCTRTCVAVATVVSTKYAEILDV